MKSFLFVLLAALVAPSWADQAVSKANVSAADTKAVAEAASAKMAGPSEDLTKEREDPNRRICKNAAPTGTRLGKRTCLTAAQWAEAQRIGKEGTNNAQTSQLMINKKGN